MPDAALRLPPRADRRGDNAWLAAWLAQPTATTTLEALHGFWRYTDVQFRCARPKGLEDGPWMVRSVRGALGRVLRGWYEAGRPSGFGATAFEAFYQHHGVLGRDHVPVPLRLSVEAGRDTIMIRARLFGGADIWRDDLIEAMAQALHGGIGLKENGSILRPWLLEDWWFDIHGSIAPPPAREAALIRFETPFKPGASEVIAGDFLASLPALFRRLRGLARWSGLEVAIDWPRVRALTQSAYVSDSGTKLAIDGFLRHRSLDDGARATAAVVGLRGHSFLLRLQPDLWPLLHLGATSHAGGHGAYGFGQFSIT